MSTLDKKSNLHDLLTQNRLHNRYTYLRSHGSDEAIKCAIEEWLAAGKPKPLVKYLKHRTVVAQNRIDKEIERAREHVRVWSACTYGVWPTNESNLDGTSKCVRITIDQDGVTYHHAGNGERHHISVNEPGALDKMRAYERSYGIER